MHTTLAFDIYGTLINPYAIATTLEKHVGGNAALFARIWREKQLEYSFRRGLMGVYKNFSVCTRQALDYACQHIGVVIPEPSKQELMEQYRLLPAYPDVQSALEKLKLAGLRMYAFSNGLPEDLQHLLGQAGVNTYLADIVSVHDVQSFKPDPAVYAYFLEQTKAAEADTWLVSSNPFDIIGASAVGWNTVWLQRDQKTVFDPWEFKPTAIVKDLSELPDIVLA